MISISLTAQEQAALEKLRLKRNTVAGERAYYVLLSSRGKSIPQISIQVGRNAHTVRLWLKRYQARGIDGLFVEKPKGRPAKLAPELDKLLRPLLESNPEAYGYIEAGWTINLMLDWLTQRNISAHPNTVRESLKRLGYCFKRFSKSPASRRASKEDRRAKVDGIVDAIKTKEDDVAIFFGDESHFSNQPYVARGWFKRGEKKR